MGFDSCTAPGRCLVVDQGHLLTVHRETPLIVSIDLSDTCCFQDARQGDFGAPSMFDNRCLLSGEILPF